MVLFLFIGVLGLVLLIISLLTDEILEGLFHTGDLGLPMPVIGAFLAAFGFGSALIAYSTSLGTGMSAVGGLGAGFVVGGISYGLTRSLMKMNTDEPVRSGDLVGIHGTVVTRIPEGGLGEVSLTVRGQIQKLGARSTQPIAAGTAVIVTSVTSPSSVVVEPISE